MGTVHTGIYGNKGIVLKLALPPAAAIDYDGDVKSVRIVSTDKDESDLTFAEAATGDLKDFTLNVTAIQSLEAGSLWRLLWDNPGKEMTVVYGPDGNAIASEDSPHFTMTVKATGKPEVGVEAKKGKDRGNFDYSFEVTAGPVLDDGA